MPRAVFPRLPALCAALLAVLLAAALPVRAEEAVRARVDAVSFSKSGDDQLLVSFRVVDAADARVAETLDSGLPVRFVFRVRLMRPSGLPFGGLVADKQFERVLEKDNLKNRYRVVEGEEKRDAASLEEALVRMGTVENYAVAPLSVADGGGVRVEIQVKLEEFRLPFHLHRILPFMNFWDVTTPWAFAAIPAELPKRP